jgi:hypothetical protein
MTERDRVKGAWLVFVLTAAWIALLALAVFEG